MERRLTRTFGTLLPAPRTPCVTPLSWRTATIRAMSRRRVVVASTAILAASLALVAQSTTPHVIAIAGSTTASLGATTFVNQGLVGVGRLSASQIDPFGDSFGSASGLQITNWTVNG